MTVTDPIADLLTRIRNANMVNHAQVEIPSSKLKVELVKILKEEGYIQDYEIKEKDGFKVIVVELKYISNKPVIRGLQRVSTPGLRSYSKAKGLMTDKLARKENIGGEVLCYVW